MRLILYFNFSRHFEKQGYEAVERLLQPFGLRNDSIASIDEKRQRLAFQAPQTAIKPGIKIMAQMILSKLALTHSKWPNK